MKRILAMRTYGACLEYCVEWVGFSRCMSDWLPATELTHCEELLQLFHEESAARGYQSDLTAPEIAETSNDWIVNECLVEIHCDEGTPGPVQVLPNGEQQYQVERILATRDMHKPGGEIECLVKWLGWPIAQASWEPVSSLSACREAVLQYWS